MCNVPYFLHLRVQFNRRSRFTRHAPLSNEQSTYKQLVCHWNGGTPTSGSVHLLATLDVVCIHWCRLHSVTPTTRIGLLIKMGSLYLYKSCTFWGSLHTSRLAKHWEQICLHSFYISLRVVEQGQPSFFPFDIYGQQHSDPSTRVTEAPQFEATKWSKSIHHTLHKSHGRCTIYLQGRGTYTTVYPFVDTMQCT